MEISFLLVHCSIGKTRQITTFSLASCKRGLSPSSAEGHSTRVLINQRNKDNEESNLTWSIFEILTL